ncbi:PA2779 family protein [Propionivibrio sp.]|uniref:PA2779 family protein n=1 Tax=Propionivibrio sp. TaxID=2212460 RepID=UPI00272E8120|nr:PA2779 family protein [Propionivibrio sp.]
MNRFQQFLAVILSMSLINATILVPVAHAGMVTTQEVATVVATGQAESGQARLAAALARDEVRTEMERQGVDPAMAIERIAALTDEEAARLADQIDTAPAGGIIGAILLVFFVLLLTDILGLTKVFPFTRSVR